MKIKVKLELELDLEEDDRIRDVKWRIDKMVGIPVENLIIDKLLSIPPFGDNSPSYRGTSRSVVYCFNRGISGILIPSR